jgi:hypothetical protein
VRPDPVDGKEAHGAFRSNKALHDKCIAVRKLLLGHEARFRVNLKDAEDADPAFAKRLRESGVNNSPMQLSKHLGRLASLPSDDGTPLPAPPAPGRRDRIRRDPRPRRPRSLVRRLEGGPRRRRRDGGRGRGLLLGPGPAPRRAIDLTI